MKNLTSISLVLLLLVSEWALAQVGPDSSWGEIYRHRFYQPNMPVIPFHAKASNGSDSRLMMVRVDEVRYFYSADGKTHLYGGTAEVCRQYTVTGSLSDSHRQCLVTETVKLIRPADYNFEYCTFRTDGDCGGYTSSREQYPLQYSVPVYNRVSERDSFNSGMPPAFYKSVVLQECRQCEEIEAQQ
ncbi:LytTR family transcriptional regulator [Hahella ganghwensis]|uniref:LytTR family transcriptional regulator n=1 Tax=Hahella ganghwensis TaxID=286420 RepID=UPI00037163AA|nr:LytTR family transcriptional regulator [Hahella ganghwensis]